MSIISRIEADTTEAMKAKQEVALSTLRLVRSAIKNAQIEQRGKELVDEDQIAITVIKRHIKQTQDAIGDFERGGRADLTARAHDEIAVMQRYLPEELGEDELQRIVAEVCAAAPAGTQTGKLIGDAMKQVSGRADGSRVRTAVEAWRRAHP